MRKRYLSWFWIFAVMISIQSDAKEVVFSTCDGKNFILDISPKETFFQVADKLQDLIAFNSKEEDLVFEVAMDAQDLAQNVKEDFNVEMGRSNPEGSRDYYRPLQAEELHAIHFIIDTLANKSLIEIYQKERELEAKGAIIDNVHPLRFFCYVFSDEKLKVGFHNISKNRFIWKDFSKGFKDSLNHESHFKNILEEYVVDLSKTLEIDKDLIYPSIQKQHWDEFFKILITQVPRKGNPRRYDN